MPVIRVTPGGTRSPSGSRTRRAFASGKALVVAYETAQPSSMTCPRGAASVAWQSTTRTGWAASTDTALAYSKREAGAFALVVAAGLGGVLIQRRRRNRRSS